LLDNHQTPKNLAKKSVRFTNTGLQLSNKNYSMTLEEAVRPLNKHQKLTLGLTLWAILAGFVILVPQLPQSVDKKIDLPFIPVAKNDKTLIFFGFSACQGVCPTTLSGLSSTLRKIKAPQRPAVYFIDIDENSSQELASSYAKQFHPKFQGFYPSRTQLKQLKNNFGLNLGVVNNEISHRGRTYLLERRDGNWWLIKVYNPETYSLDTIAEEFIET